MLNDYREVGKTVELVTVPAAHAWAIDVQDESRGLRARLGAAELVVGTARGVDVLLRDDAVSGRHCSVCVLGGGVAIRDSSARGTGPTSAALASRRPGEARVRWSR